MHKVPSVPNVEASKYPRARDDEPLSRAFLLEGRLGLVIVTTEEGHAVDLNLPNSEE
jgi:hypothetical protein